MDARLRSIIMIISFSIIVISGLFVTNRITATPWNATDGTVTAWASFVGLIAMVVVIASEIRELVTHA
jgi:hypothetical protein